MQRYLTALRAFAAAACTLTLVPMAAGAQTVTRISVNHLPPLLRQFSGNTSQWFSFLAQTGHTYTISTLDHGPNGRTRIQLLSHDRKTQLTQGTFGSAGGFGATATWKASRSGLLYVVAAGMPPANGAQFEIQVHGVAGTAAALGRPTVASKPAPPGLINPRPNPYGGVGAVTLSAHSVPVGRPVVIHYSVSGTHGTAVGAQFIVITPGGAVRRASRSLTGQSGTFQGSVRFTGTAMRGIYRVICFWHIEGFGVNGDVCIARTQFTVR
ncbi:MAG: hypothetical protein KGJ62_15710 [Armatimonadetes bacterium]|nr:hypothetical protein [Armatimonadota bacterium]MDE2208048.1 hypothetical protein [Armatimonadota bacterium]